MKYSNLITTILGLGLAIVTFLDHRHYLDQDTAGLLFAFLLAIQGFFTNQKESQD